MEVPTIFRPGPHLWGTIFKLHMEPLDIEDDTVWSNLFYLLPAPFTFMIGIIPGTVVLLAGLNLFYRSGRYHTTYERHEQGDDASAMLTYLVALISATLSPCSLWFLLLPVVAAPLHRRFVWDIDSYVATPIYIVAALIITYFQVGLWAGIPALFAIAGGLVKLSQPGPRTKRHSLWHLFGGVSAASATGLVAFIVILA